MDSPSGQLHSSFPRLSWQPESKIVAIFVNLMQKPYLAGKEAFESYPYLYTRSSLAVKFARLGKWFSKLPPKQHKKYRPIPTRKTDLASFGFYGKVKPEDLIQCTPSLFISFVGTANDSQSGLGNTFVGLQKYTRSLKSLRIVFGSPEHCRAQGGKGEPEKSPKIILASC